MVDSIPVVSAPVGVTSGNGVPIGSPGGKSRSPNLMTGQALSKIQICDGAAIDEVVNQYGGSLNVVGVKPPLGTSVLPFGDDLDEIGFVSSPVAGCDW